MHSTITSRPLRPRKDRRSAQNVLALRLTVHRSFRSESASKKFDSGASPPPFRAFSFHPSIPTPLSTTFRPSPLHGPATSAFPLRPSVSPQPCPSQPRLYPAAQVAPSSTTTMSPHPNLFLPIGLKGRPYRCRISTRCRNRPPRSSIPA